MQQTQGQGQGTISQSGVMTAQKSMMFRNLQQKSLQRVGQPSSLLQVYCSAANNTRLPTI